MLVKARDQHSLSFLQPGRFLCRGTLGDVPYLWFSPLDVADGVDTFAPHTLGALMTERFEVYKREAVTRFYEDHFRHYSRQIVLVDVLRALLAGREAFDDTRLALDANAEPVVADAPKLEPPHTATVGKPVVTKPIQDRVATMPATMAPTKTAEALPPTGGAAPAQ